MVSILKYGTVSISVRISAAHKTKKMVATEDSTATLIFGMCKLNSPYMTTYFCSQASLVPRPRAPPGSGERSRVRLLRSGNDQ